MVALGASLLIPPVAGVDKAPDVSLVDVDGVPFKLSDYRDEVLILDFFFLACSPCKELAHDLKDLDDKGIEGLNILSIDTVPSDSASAIKDYASSNGYNWRFTKDTGDGDAARAYSIIRNPTIIIIDGEGYATFRDSADVDIDEIEREARRALRGEAEPIAIIQLGLIAMALLTGLASFFSPCSFPLLPGYITYYFKMGADLRKKQEVSGDEVGPREEPEEPTKKSQIMTGLKLGSLSGIGVVLVYLIIGIIVLSLLGVGVYASGISIAILEPIVGIILIIMGLLTALEVPINWGYVTAPFRRLRDRIRPRKGPQKPSFSRAGLFLYGVGYGSASASCSAPAFIALASISVQRGGPIDVVVTFIVFLFSLWLLMAVVTVFLTVSEEKVKVGLMKHYIVIKKVTGVVFLAVGIYLVWLFLSAEGYI